jgi:hypothetical protein
MAIPRGGGGGKGARASGGGGGAGTAAKSDGGGGLGGTSITPTQFQSAFNKADATGKFAGENLVSLDQFRATLGGTREAQDKAIRAMRVGGKYGLSTHEGLHGGVTASQKDASIHEAGSRYVYISRR